MAKDSRAANGAAKKNNLLMFDPDDLVIVQDEASALNDDRAYQEPDERMVRSIMTYGVLQPIVVRKNPETGKTEVVAGRRRTLAARAANQRLKKEGRDPIYIGGTVKRSSALDSLGMMVVENEQREQDTPMNRAKKAARFLDLGGTEEDACIAFGMSKATLKNLIALLEAPAVVRKAVESGAIAASDGYKLAKLEPEEAKKKVEQLKTEAPRAPGKKRSPNAKKAREIVDGGKAARSKKEIAAMLEEIQKSESISENKRLGAEAALEWVLGDNEAIKKIL